MKRIFYLFGLAAALLLVCSCTALDNETIVGTWNMDKHSHMGRYTNEDGQTLSSYSYFEFDGKNFPDMYTHLTFNADGTGSHLTSHYDADNTLTSMETPFSWTLEEGELYMTVSEGKSLFTANGFKATLTGSKLYLEKIVKDDENDFEENLILFRISE
ncbi:MAG: lipocalin family protein [Bacteroidales bacterium]|nr:lipocalin family protein [Candidatus Equibacterium intestinale]